jgi:hypothetical protein
VTKEELITAIRKCAEQLGHSPSRDDLYKFAAIGRKALSRHFGTHQRALEECNLDTSGCGRTLEMRTLFLDWAGLARALNKIPNFVDYEEKSRFSVRPLKKRFGLWKHVPTAMKHYIEENGLATEWADVVALIDKEPKGKGGNQGVSAVERIPKVMMDRPMYGAMTGGRPMVCGPTNESGVIFLFGVLAERLGFLVLRIQTEFPDCEAWRVVGEDRLQKVRIEFEYASRNFWSHGHDPAGCDLIVCWEDNWLECPVEVVELKSVMG